MNDRNTTAVPVARILGLLVFAGSVAVLGFVLVFMNVASGGTPFHGVGNADDLGPPLVVAAVAGLTAICALVVPRLVLRPLQRRVDGSKRLEAYASTLFVSTLALGVVVNLLGFITAFMTQELAHWLLAVVAAALPAVRVWPTSKRRERWASAGIGGAQRVLPADAQES